MALDFARGSPRNRVPARTGSGPEASRCAALNGVGCRDFCHGFMPSLLHPPHLLLYLPERRWTPPVVRSTSPAAAKDRLIWLRTHRRPPRGWS